MKSLVGAIIFFAACATAAVQPTSTGSGQAALTGSGQGYPNRTVRIIVPFPPGSGPDLIARIVGQQLQEDLRQNFIIDNKAGAQGSIGATEAAKAAPDGYTLFVPTNTTHAANPSLFKTLAYDPVKDFAPIARLCASALMLVVKPEFPAGNIKEFLAYAKTHELPAIAETLPGFDLSTWYGLLAPAGTPRDVIVKLQDAALKAITKPEVKAKFASINLDPAPMNAEPFGEFIGEIAPHGVVKSVYIQINVAPQAEVAEVAWVQSVAECSNVYVKLSGLGTFEHRCSIELWQPVVRETLAMFDASAERLEPDTRRRSPVH